MEEELQKQAAEAAAKAQAEGSKPSGAPAPANPDSGKSALERRGEAILKGSKASQVDMVVIPAYAQVEAAELAAKVQAYSAEKQVEAAYISAKAQSDAVYQNRKAEEAQAEAQKYSADKQAEGAKAQADAAVKVSENELEKERVESSTAVKVAEVEAGADVQVAKINQATELLKTISEDGRTLDANEIKVLSILQKYGFENFTDSDKFKSDISEVDYEKMVTLPFFTIDRNDYKELEKALKGDGKLLKADGKIDQETLLAINALVLENVIPAAATLGVDALGKLNSGTSVNPEMLKGIDNIFNK